MANPISTDDALRVLHRYQRWRKGESEKGFDEYGLDVKEIGAALDQVLAQVPILTRELARTRSQLAKCQVQRERFHAALRAKKVIG